MRVSTIAGLVVVAGLILIVMASGGQLGVFADIPSFIIVGGTAVCLQLMAGGMGGIFDLPRQFRVAFSGAVGAIHARDARSLRQLAIRLYVGGAIGVLVGLIQVVALLHKPEYIGPSVAFILETFLYAVVFAECLVRPCAGRIERLSREGQQPVAVEVSQDASSGGHGDWPSENGAVNDAGLVGLISLPLLILISIILGSPAILFIDAQSFMVVAGVSMALQLATRGGRSFIGMLRSFRVFVVNAPAKTVQLSDASHLKQFARYIWAAGVIGSLVAWIVLLATWNQSTNRVEVMVSCFLPLFYALVFAECFVRPCAQRIEFRLERARALGAVG